MSEKKIAVVTGGARGIGKAIALELAKAGNFVVINYNGSEEKPGKQKQRSRQLAARQISCSVMWQILMHAKLFSKPLQKNTDVLTFW
mgnify:CR=1 FL=1